MANFRQITSPRDQTGDRIEDLRDLVRVELHECLASSRHGTLLIASSPQGRSATVRVDVKLFPNQRFWLDDEQVQLAINRWGGNSHPEDRQVCSLDQILDVIFLYLAQCFSTTKHGVIQVEVYQAKRDRTRFLLPGGPVNYSLDVISTGSQTAISGKSAHQTDLPTWRKK